MAEPPTEVKELVKRYERERRVLESAAYGEADTRKEFIEPLFTALGWDVVNKNLFSEAYKDVVNEYSLKIGGSHKAPDYAFRIGGNRVFSSRRSGPALIYPGIRQQRISSAVTDGPLSCRLASLPTSDTLPFTTARASRQKPIGRMRQEPSSCLGKTSSTGGLKLRSCWAKIRFIRARYNGISTRRVGDGDFGS